MTTHYDHARLSPAVVETLAGFTAGVASTLAVHPLDVIKTRLQIHKSTSSASRNSLSVFRALIHNPRPIQSLYRGLTPNLVGNSTSWALFFYFKSLVETQLLAFHRSPFAFPTTQSIDNVQTQSQGQRSQPRREQGQLSPLDYFIASGVSGLLITVATNPIWVLKTRMLSSDAAASGAYSSMWVGAKDVWAKDGWKGFYRGLGISMVGVSHGAVQFAVYEPLKRSWLKYVARDGQGSLEVEGSLKIGNEATLLISGAAKVVAGTATYPYQVVRSRLQTYDAEERFGRGIRGVVSKVVREEGWRGFYKGLGPSVVRVMPATWVTFLVYENVRFYLPTWAG